MTVMAADLGSWTTILAGLLGGGLVALINGLLLRPKTTAEAKQTNVTAEVSVSADSRQWVEQAMTRARNAEERLDAVELENDDLRSAMLELVDYVRRLYREWGSPTPPPPPPKLEDRLGGSHRRSHGEPKPPELPSK